MRANDTSVFEFLTTQRTYTIPVYQRNYDWKEDHCKKLLQDIIKVGENPTDPEYFLGSFVIVQKELADPFNYYIIDGQQRLTSLTLLLLAIYHNESDIAKGTTPQIDKLIFSNIASSEKKLILKQIQRDDTYLNKIIYNEEFNGDDSNISNNYILFVDYINKHQDEILTIMKGINKLRIVQITLNDQDKPQLVFETLNATGKKLSEADKIRNYILMYKNQDTLYEKYWVKIEENCLQNQDPNRISNFMKSFLTIEFRENVTKPIKDGDVYEVFKEYIEKMNNKNNEEILQSILEYSICYNIILTAKINTKNKRIISSLQNIKQFGFTALDSIILCILKQEYDSIISSDCAASMIFLLENYLIRRWICSLPSNALNKVSFALIKKVLSQDSEEDIKKSFEQSLLSFQGSAQFPTDDLFIERIKTRKMYGNTAGVLGRFILEHLENQNTKERNNYEEITIEHIMPRTLNSNWKKDLGKSYKESYDLYLHTIGNMTLTGYNSEQSNNSFNEKLSFLKNSKFKFLNKDFEITQFWNEISILERTSRLATALLKCYPYPNIQINTKSYDIFDNLDFTNTTIIQYEYNSTITKLPERTWSSFIVQLCGTIYSENPVDFHHYIIDNPEFNTKISYESKNQWTPITIKDRTLYINTMQDTTTKIRTINRIFETLQLDPQLTVTLHIED